MNRHSVTELPPNIRQNKELYSFIYDVFRLESTSRLESHGRITLRSWSLAVEREVVSSADFCTFVSWSHELFHDQLRGFASTARNRFFCCSACLSCSGFTVHRCMSTSLKSWEQTALQSKCSNTTLLLVLHQQLKSNALVALHLFITDLAVNKIATVDQISSSFTSLTHYGLVMKIVAASSSLESRERSSRLGGFHVQCSGQSFSWPVTSSCLPNVSVTSDWIGVSSS